MDDLRISYIIIKIVVFSPAHLSILFVMHRRYSLIYATLFLLLFLGGCDLFFGKTVEGRLDMEVSLRGFSLDRGLDIDNRNFIVQDSIAYELVFLPDTRLKNFPASRNGISIPVPAELGSVRLEPGASYRIQGKPEPTGERYRGMPVEMMHLRSIEYLAPKPSDGGLHIRL